MSFLVDTLPIEVLHLIVFQTNVLTPVDVLNLASTCSALYNALLCDATTIAFVRSLASLLHIALGTRVRSESESASWRHALTLKLRRETPPHAELVEAFECLHISDTETMCIVARALCPRSGSSTEWGQFFADLIPRCVSCRDEDSYAQVSACVCLTLLAEKEWDHVLSSPYAAVQLGWVSALSNNAAVYAQYGAHLDLGVIRAGHRNYDVLCAALRGRCPAVAAAVLRDGHSVDDGAAALFAAVESSDAETVAFALSARFGSVDSAAFVEACRHGNVDVVALLMAGGGDVNAPQPSRWGGHAAYPLFTACSMGRNAVARKLLDAGAVLNGMGDHRDTCLHTAAQHGNVDLVDLLVERGADVNARRADGWSVLGTACHYRNANVVRILLAAGADASADGKPGSSLMTIAANMRANVIVDLLAAAGLTRESPPPPTTGFFDNMVFFS